MDPVSVIVTALVLGIAAGAQPSAEDAVKSAYSGLKTLIQNRYKINVDNLEKKPASPAQQEAVKESLAEAKAGEDQELLDRSKALVDAIEAHNPDAAATIGVDIKGLKSAYLKASEINAGRGSTGMKVTDSVIDKIELGPIKTQGSNDPN